MEWKVMKERIKDVDERRAEGKQLGVIWAAWSCWRVSVLSHPGPGQYCTCLQLRRYTPFSILYLYLPYAVPVQCIGTVYNPIWKKLHTWKAKQISRPPLSSLWPYKESKSHQCTYSYVSIHMYVYNCTSMAGEWITYVKKENRSVNWERVKNLWMSSLFTVGGDTGERGRRPCMYTVQCTVYSIVPVHRLNMELYIQILFGLYVHSCTDWLGLPPPAFWLIYEGAIGQPR